MSAIAVGDSVVFGWGVRGEEAWVNLLGRRTGSVFINMGVPGYSSVQATRMLERYGMPLGPKVVLWGFTQNDLDDNLVFDEWDRNGTGTDYISYGARRRKEALDRMDPWMGRAREWLRQRSVTYELLRLVVRGNDRIVYRNGDLDFVFDPSEWQETLTPQLYERGAQLTINAIRSAKALTERGGAQLIVIMFPGRAQAYWPLIRQHVQGTVGVDIDGRTRLIGDFCRQQGIPVLDLTGPFRTRASRGEQLFFRFDQHFNALGNMTVAEEVLDFLANKGLHVRPPALR